MAGSVGGPAYLALDARMLKMQGEELLHMKAEYDSVCYARTFLSEVAVQIDFLEPPDTLNGKVLPGNIQAELKKNFPIYEPVSASSHELTFSEEGIAASREEKKRYQSTRNKLLLEQVTIQPTKA
jgi:uncharacterized protein (TIGR04255 family)